MSKGEFYRVLRVESVVQARNRAHIFLFRDSLEGTIRKVEFIEWRDRMYTCGK